MAGKSTRTQHPRDSLEDLSARTDSLSLDEVNDRYEGEWILLLVTDEDERQNPIRGRVLEHSKSDGQITRAIRRIRAKHPDVLLQTFVAGKRVMTGDAARRYLGDLAISGRGLHARS
jgi:hypothetical protein